MHHITMICIRGLNHVEPILGFQKKKMIAQMNNFFSYICISALVLSVPTISFAQHNANKIIQYIENSGVMYYCQIDHMIGGRDSFVVDSLNNLDLIILANHITDTKTIALWSSPESSKIENIPIGMLYAYMIEKNFNLFFRCIEIKRRDMEQLSTRDLLAVREIYLRVILNDNLPVYGTNVLEKTDYLWGNCY